MTSEDPQAGRPEERGRPQAVALVGFMGAGKSAVGRELAAALGIPFVDTDELVVAEAGPIAAIFAERGEAGFRALEEDVVTAAISAAADSPCVLALGGGAVLSEAVREALRSLPHVVWLAAPPEELWARVAGEGPRVRPLAADEPSFKQLLAASRAPVSRGRHRGGRDRRALPGGDRRRCGSRPGRRRRRSHGRRRSRSGGGS